jgi:transposase
MHRGPHPKPLVLSEADRELLGGWLRRSTIPQALALRARIVLACADRPNASNTEIGLAFGVDRATVRKWRTRFVRRGPDGLADDPRPGAPKRITEAEVERVLALTVESAPPPDAKRWSTRRMAHASGLSQTTVSRIWRSFALRLPHAAAGPNSHDVLLIEHVRDIAGLYMSPPDHVLALAVDGADHPAKTGDAEPAESLALRTSNGRYGRAYIRHGMMALLSALEVKAGPPDGAARRRGGAGVRRMLEAIDRGVAPAHDVHLVLSDSVTCTAIKQWLSARPRFHVHITATPSLWMNLLEWWLPLLTTRRVRAGSPGHASALVHAIEQYLAPSDAPAAPFVWIGGHAPDGSDQRSVSTRPTIGR